MSGILGLGFGISCLAASPSQGELESALVKARAEWGIGRPIDVVIVSERLNECDLKMTPRIASMEDRWVETTITYEGSGESTVSKTHVYVIKVNSACDWSNRALSLQNAVTHEFGHILLGYEYHSPDKRSIMNYVVRSGGQQITLEDRKRLDAAEAALAQSPAVEQHESTDDCVDACSPELASK